jgi:hypothetical protein
MSKSWFDLSETMSDKDISPSNKIDNNPIPKYLYCKHEKKHGECGNEDKCLFYHKKQDAIIYMIENAPKARELLQEAKIKKQNYSSATQLVPTYLWCKKQGKGCGVHCLFFHNFQEPHIYMQELAPRANAMLNEYKYKKQNLPPQPPQHFLLHQPNNISDTPNANISITQLLAENKRLLEENKALTIEKKMLQDLFATTMRNK